MARVRACLKYQPWKTKHPWVTIKREVRMAAWERDPGVWLSGLQLPLALWQWRPAGCITHVSHTRTQRRGGDRAG